MAEVGHDQRLLREGAARDERRGRRSATGGKLFGSGKRVGNRAYCRVTQAQSKRECYVRTGGCHYLGNTQWGAPAWCFLRNLRRWRLELTEGGIYAKLIKVNDKNYYYYFLKPNIKVYFYLLLRHQYRIILFKRIRNRLELEIVTELIGDIQVYVALDLVKWYSHTNVCSSTVTHSDTYIVVVVVMLLFFHPLHLVKTGRSVCNGAFFLIAFFHSFLQGSSCEVVIVGSECNL